MLTLGTLGRALERTGGLGRMALTDREERRTSQAGGTAAAKALWPIRTWQV